MARIGFSQRKTVAYLYAWTTLLAGVAVALRFVPYSDHHHHYRAGWLALMIFIAALAVAASVYLVYVLEILKFKSFRARELRQVDPDTNEHEIDQRVARELETGEFEAVADPQAEERARPPASGPRVRAPGSPTAGRPR
jgi:UDP-GlcNAc:undecaprenyl-phosphate GlcNAc-1-phosphate transferase